MADAVREALEQVRQQPRSADAWGRLGMLLQANGFDQHVERCFDEASRFDPDNPDWPYLRGIHLLQSSPSQAVTHLEKALALSEIAAEKAAIHFRLALVFIELGAQQEAAHHLDSLRTLTADDARAKFASGLLALSRGDRSTASTQLASLTDSPFCKKLACHLLAGVVEKEASRGLQERAARFPQDVAWPDPIEARMRALARDRMSRFDEFRALVSQGRHEHALGILRNLLAKSPDEEVCFILGFELLKRSQFEEAEAVFRMSLQYDVTNVKTHLFLASCLLEQGKNLPKEPANKEKSAKLFGQALEAADKTLELQPELASAHLTRGAALKFLGRRNEALAALSRVVLIQPDNSEGQLFLGEMLAEGGQLEEGLKHLRYAVRFAKADDPRPADALKKWLGMK